MTITTGWTSRTSPQSGLMASSTTGEEGVINESVRVHDTTEYNTGLARAAWGFLATFVAASALLALVDPGVNGFGDALWCCFQAVTTIGYGDITVTSTVGRAIVVVLSVVGILFVAVLTAAVVSYCNELMLARRNESLALYLDKLEHLDQLTQGEPAELSRKVSRLRGSQE